MKTRFPIFLSILFLALIGCKYERKQGCRLDQLHVNGNVTKIETIVQSTIPLTEMFYDTFGADGSIAMVGGNFVFEFDNHGEIIKSIGYGIDGEILFQTTKFPESKNTETYATVVGNTNTNDIDRVETESTTDGKIESIKYYTNDTLLYIQKVYFNDNGEVSKIVKNIAL